LLSQIDLIVAIFRQLVEKKISEWLPKKSPDGFREAELELAGLGRELCDEITAAVLHTMLADPSFQARACAAAYASGKLRSGGARDVSVTLLGGGETSVKVPYLKPDLRGRRGRKRKSGRRGRGGSGLYPTLAALGIWYGVTGALAGEICRQVADSDSVRAGREALARRGIDLGHKQTLRIVNKFSGRAVKQRDEWLSMMRQRPSSGGPLAGKRVVVGTDGGRCRIRLPAQAGRKRANGHRRYDAPWREPKLLVIYVIDDNGRPERVFQPVYDGTMEACEAVFAMLIGYLKALGAADAAQLIIVADGAKWIWGRSAELVAAVGIDPSMTREVLDWYHAVETLHTIVGIPAKWCKKSRSKWLRRAIKFLKHGRIDQLIQHIRTLAVGRRAKKVNSHVGYFQRNAHRMQYAAFRAEKIPLGSGAVESAVRRVINLRIKGNAKFWREANAEGMLLLRGYLKAGRFDDLFDWSLRAAAPWWGHVGDPVNPHIHPKEEPQTGVSSTDECLSARKAS